MSTPLLDHNPPAILTVSCYRHDRRSEHVGAVEGLKTLGMGEVVLAGK